MAGEILRFKPEEVTKMFAEGKMEVVDNAPPVLNMEQAREIFGRDFLDPEAVEKTFGIQIPADQIPDIPFELGELERAKELDQFLILRFDKTTNGQPLTMQKMKLLCYGGILHNSKNDEWPKTERFCISDTPKARWALVSKEVIPLSIDRNYLDQTQLIAEYLRDQVFRGGSMPSEYQEAIRQFDSQKAGIPPWWQGKTAGSILPFLKINQMTRHTPVEALYDLLVYFQKNGHGLFQRSDYTWTCTTSSAGYPVKIGYFAWGSVGVGGWWPDHETYDSNVGVYLSRSAD